MILALKVIHIAAIAIWAGGIVSLPGLYVQRAHVQDKESLYRLQMMVRFAYVSIISPAAFLAVISGTLLIFGRETFAGWFSIKLFFVGLLVILHVLTGLIIIRLFREGEIYPVWRFIVATIITCAVILVILLVVLAKPPIDIAIPAALMEPGGLRRLVQGLSPWTIP
ncbi:CopD family protein [Rhizobium sp. NTR19]|uniref:Protoporphyrinogen IX oxidase n=1 Tax=Neorhizobium turbinariae TaxID=2937795 RepID=A0ABT0IQ19_9HYPH|nr:CopD family protein [Neorhizobium turbinariae]MCK8779956.1 CopD family protein [Neorhizobium turbinariae]